jgi:hypothetical protein
LGITNLQGQNYIPTALDSAVWFFAGNYNFSTGEHESFGIEFTRGDTIVNNVHYYKVYSLSDSEPLRLKMLIRDNIFTHTVHAIFMPHDIFTDCTPLVDVPLFDFSPFIANQISNQVVGTATGCDGITYNVYSVDTINIYGKDRRRFELDNKFWIEGIGNSYAGLSPGAVSNPYFGFHYCRGTPEDCGAYIFLNSKDIRTYQNGKLYPNPAQHQTRLELEEYIHHGRVLIYNLLGQLQSEQYFEGQEATLDVRNYEKGIYMVQVFDKEKLVFGEKLVVN